jgi:hypothetical protein
VASASETSPQGLSERSLLEPPVGHEWASLGNNTACALDKEDPKAMKGAKVKKVAAYSQSDCRRRCEAEHGCKGLEYDREEGSCDLWLQAVTMVDVMEGNECVVLVRSGEYHRHKQTVCHAKHSGHGPYRTVKGVSEEVCNLLCQATLGDQCTAVEYIGKHKECKMWNKHVSHAKSHIKDSSCSAFEPSASDAKPASAASTTTIPGLKEEPCESPLCSVGRTWDSWGLDQVFPWAADSTTTTMTETTTTVTTITTATTTGTTTHTVTTTREYCHTAVLGELCHKNVMWVKTEGIRTHPEWYPHLTSDSSFEDIQQSLNASVSSSECPVPCTSPSLYCFTVVTEDAVAFEGHPIKKGLESELLEQQRSVGAGVFACDASSVYKGKQATMGERSVANTKIFVDIWKQVHENAVYKKYDWTVKVDVDTVFFPHRLRQHLWELMPSLDKPMFVQNIEFEFGMMGAMEVVNAKAVDIFVKSSGACLKKIGEHGGEDYFLHECLVHSHGVGHAVDTTLLSDKYALKEGSWNWFDITPCTNSSAVAFHPFKAVDAWMGCQAVALGLENLSSFTSCDAAEEGAACRRLENVATNATKEVGHDGKKAKKEEHKGKKAEKSSTTQAPKKASKATSTTTRKALRKAIVS